MRIEDFKQQMNLYKQARESNPSLSYWEWKSQMYDVLDKVEQSDANFVQRLNQFNRSTIPDWKVEGNVATHKMSWTGDPNGDTAIVYPEVQEINSQLYDFTNPKYKHNKWDALDSAIERGDTIMMTPKQAQQFTSSYKGFYPFSYEDGTDGIVDKLKSNSRNTLTPEEQQYLLNKSKQRQRMSGAITPVFDIQDAVDFTPVGDVLAARDTYNAFRDQDYITASAMLGLMLAPPALGKIAKEAVPSFVTAAADKINELRRKERRNKELDTKIFSQGIEDRNRIIEELYDTPGIWDRAYNADITYGTNYVDTYNNLINNYYSNYFNLPEPKRTNIGDAKAKMTATQAAIDRYNLDGTPASWSDFEYLVSPDIEQLDKALTRHELGHYIDFNMSRSSNPDAGNLMFNEMRKDLSIDPNPMMPSETSYFRTGSEQKSYMNTLRQFMFDNNMINKIDDKVTTKKIQEAIDKLPSELNSVKAAYKQFKSPRKYTKWFNTIPLLGVTPFMLNYSEENNSN